MSIPTSITKKDKLTDIEWIKLIEKTVSYKHSGMRLGQSYMNALRDINMELYDIVSGSDVH